LLNTQMIREKYDRLPHGTRRAIAGDLSLTEDKMARAVFGYVENEMVVLRVNLWLAIMGDRPKVPTFKENVEARKARKILGQRLVSDPLSTVLVRDVIGMIVTEYFTFTSGLSNQRLYAIIASNFPLEEHIGGEALIGYRMLDENEEWERKNQESTANEEVG
jgi:hypothetical protein